MQEHLEQIRTSRLRLAQTTFDERQRIQRDLHDDAQQRLVKVLRLLDQTGRQLTQSGMPADVSGTVQQAPVELTDAVWALRELTQGIYPAVLIDHGLAAAVENLVDRAPLPVNATVTTSRRPKHVEDQGFYLDLLTDGLRGRGIEVVGRAGNPTEALRVIDDTAPDLAVLDISLSRTRVDRVHDVEGLRVAELVRADYPDVGLLMLSAHVEAAYAQRLLAMENNPRAVGYLGKEHLGNLDELIDAFRRIVRGEIVIDSGIISQLMSRRRVEDPLERLTPYQKRVLALVAEGHSNLGIARHLDCKISNVEQHLSAIFDKLGLSQATGHDRRRINLRVLATLTFLRSTDRPDTMGP